MDLYVIRHAIAENAIPGHDDADRQLTDIGRKKLKQVARGLRKVDIAFDRLLTSPWLRARQTAELIEPLSDSPMIATELLCQPPKTELLALIAETGATTAIVGHEPWLGELIGWLVFGDQRHGDGLLIKKAGVVWLEGSAVPGGMTLRAVIPPRLLRDLA